MYIKHPALLALPIVIFTLMGVMLTTEAWGLFPLGLGLGIASFFVINSNLPKTPFEWPEQSFHKDEYGLICKMRNTEGKYREDRVSWTDVARHIPRYYLPNGGGQEKIVYQSSIWHVLGIMPTKDKTKIISAFKKMSLVYHPDVGGDNKAFNTLVNARDKALAKC